MRSKKNIETIKMQEGEYLECEFDNYLDMAKNAPDWTHFCPYQLQRNSIEGIYKILELPSMQIAYTDMSGGIMFDFVVPEDRISFSIAMLISNKACLNEMKLKTGMIAIMDDKKIYNFMYNSRVKLLDISFKKNAHPDLFEKLSHVIDKHYFDKDKTIADLLKSIIDEYSDKIPLAHQDSIKIEKRVTTALLQLISEQEANTSQLTHSEKIAIDIKKQLFSHMDGDISISTLAIKHKISEKSLQNSFRSLYDLKPVQFIRLLKLNLVHHELIKSKEKDKNVMRIAQKWGFKHMGRFSKYYTELFGENPSVTLKNMIPLINGMSEDCVQRKEEVL